MLSYNLGGAPEDHELLLASFYEPFNEYITLKWQANDDLKAAEQLPKAFAFRTDFYLTAVALTKISENDKDLQKKVSKCMSDHPLNQMQEALTQFIESEPGVKDKITNFLQELLEKAALLDPGLRKYCEGKNIQDLIKEFKPVIADQLLRLLRQNAESNAADQIFSNNQKPDVLFLQEVGDENRTLMTSVKTHNFTLARFDSGHGYDSLVALNPDRFENIVDYSCSLKQGDHKKDCAICVATDKQTHKRFVFASAHIAGFSYALTGEQLLVEANRGNEFCKNLLAKLEEIEKKEKAANRPIDATVIGCDINASPEKLKGRFSLFTDKGFKVKRTGSATNVHFMDTADKVREIDYFFSKTKRNIWHKCKNIFKSSDKITVSAKSFSNFGFDMQNNMSDHKPIAGRVTIEEQKSIFASIWSKIKSIRITKVRP